MKVQGNNSPPQVEIRQHETNRQLAYVILRENIKDIHTEEAPELFEYDEYSVCCLNDESLESIVREHFDEWIETGREVEFNALASISVDMQNALKMLGVE